MAQKFSTVDKEERKTIEDELDSKSQALGMDSFESYGNDSHTGMKALVGMCYNCKNLNYCKTEFGNVHAVCGMFDFKFSGKNRITECNLHTPKNVLSLQEMYNIAWLIDKDTGKKVNGFIQPNNKGGE
jgi:hypothetical protein